MFARKLYLPVFLIAIGLLGVTGHYGGSMTHGEDFLFVDNSIKKVIITDVEKAEVYSAIIQPFFDGKCVSCHNSNKLKGGLLMSSKEGLLTGGDSGSLLDSTSTSKASLLLQRIHLPMDEEEHMPPKGKVQPTPEEIALLNWWIANDHCFDCVVAELKKTEEIQEILDALEEDTSPRAMIAKEVDEVPADWLAGFDNTGISVAKLSEKSPLLQVTMSRQKHLSIREFKALDKFSENVVALNLANSNFSDTLAVALPFFKNLTKLQLQHTAITDKTIEKLKDFEHLESLNLYGTAITENSLSQIQELPQLRTVYLWQTQMTKDQMEHYALNFPKVKVQGQIDESIFASTSLAPPTINAEKDFFKDSLQVILDYAFTDADIYYTLDGTEPDSTSLKYTRPIILTQSAQIKTRVHKTGWQMSEIISDDFKKTTLAISSIELNKKPNEKYKGQGGKTLMDQKRGSTNLLDGNWLGYEGRNFTAVIQLKKQKTVSSISIGALSSPDKWIFFPVGFKVWTSQNGTEYKLVHKEKQSPEKPNSDTKLRFFDLDIPPTTTTFIKLEVLSPLKNPPWHPNPGGNSWLFIDEILLN